VSASRVLDGVQEKDPLLGMPTTRVERGTTLVEGPRSRTSETVLGVVGCQEMVKALQAGTIW
jgi:hypothetical protein